MRIQMNLKELSSHVASEAQNEDRWAEAGRTGKKKVVLRIWVVRTACGTIEVHYRVCRRSQDVTERFGFSATVFRWRTTLLHRSAAPQPTTLDLAGLRSAR